MCAVSDETKGSFSELVPKLIPVFDAPHKFELFEVINMEGSLLFKRVLLRGLSLKSSSYIYNILITLVQSWWF